MLMTFLAIWVAKARHAYILSTDLADADGKSAV
jgi:hypothetical protein